MRTSTPSERTNPRHVRAFFFGISLLLGLLQTWAHRNDIGGDGVNYVDMGYAFIHGDWHTAINGYWSPLYGWILGVVLAITNPGPYWMSTVAHLATLLVFLLSFSAFSFLIAQFSDLYRDLSRDSEVLVLPDWVLLVFGYALFLWTALDWVGLMWATPDMLVTAIVYAASGMLLYFRNHPKSLLLIVFGVLLGLGYLSKTAFFPVACVFIVVTAIQLRGTRKAVQNVAAVLIAFVLTCAPFVITLSKARGHLTLGDSGLLNYVWCVNDVPRWHWQGSPAGNGAPVHPTRELSADPPVYEYANPVGGTDPEWYDPSYWFQGVVPHFHAGQQIRVTVENLEALASWLTRLNGSVVTMFLLFAFMRAKPIRAVLFDIGYYWCLLIPATAAIALYALVHIDPRYVAAYVVVLWLCLLAGIRVSNNATNLKMATGMVLIVFATLFIPFGETGVARDYSQLPKLLRPTSRGTFAQAAERLSAMGIKPGDRIACTTHASYSGISQIAQLAKTRVVAEVFFESEPALMPGQLSRFWNIAQNRRAQALRILQKTGVKAVLSPGAPTSAKQEGWQRLTDTGIYVYRFHPERNRPTI